MTTFQINPNPDQEVTSNIATRPCRNCKWLYVGWIEWFLNGYQFATCLHVKALFYDSRHRKNARALVTGETPKFHPEDFYYCSVMRQHECGTSGQFWEPKTTSKAESTP